MFFFEEPYRLIDYERFLSLLLVLLCDLALAIPLCVSIPGLLLLCYHWILQRSFVPCSVSPTNSVASLHCYC